MSFVPHCIVKADICPQIPILKLKIGRKVGICILQSQCSSLKHVFKLIPLTKLNVECIRKAWDESGPENKLLRPELGIWPLMKTAMTIKDVQNLSKLADHHRIQSLFPLHFHNTLLKL